MCIENYYTKYGIMRLVNRKLGGLYSIADIIWALLSHLSRAYLKDLNTLATSAISFRTLSLWAISTAHIYTHARCVATTALMCVVRFLNPYPSLRGYYSLYVRIYRISLK